MKYVGRMKFTSNIKLRGYGIILNIRLEWLKEEKRSYTWQYNLTNENVVIFIGIIDTLA